MKKLVDYSNFINESGIRGIKKIAEKYKEAEIYFHVDLDGVASAISMREYLKRYGIKTVKYNIIQYGSSEFDLIKPQEGRLPVLVDFAHGKGDFVIHTDHHNKQVGVVTDKTSTHFKKSKSNAEVISSEISTSDVFRPEEMRIISMIDSADYAANDVTPDDVIQFIYMPTNEVSKNIQKLGFVVNKLILAYKSKPSGIKSFLPLLVERSQPSFISLFLNIKKLMVELNLDPIEKMMISSDTYYNSGLEKKIANSSLFVKNHILLQYHAPSMRDTGAYDRYASFKKYPDVDFFIMAWPIGLLQVSFNPFKKKDPRFDDVDLIEMSNDILLDYKDDLKDIKVSLSELKQIAEKTIIKSFENIEKKKIKAELEKQKEAEKAEKERLKAEKSKGKKGKTLKENLEEDSKEIIDELESEYDYKQRFGFRYEDLMNYFKGKINGVEKINDERLKEIYDKKFIDLGNDEKEILEKAYIDAWTIFDALSGGHKKIANIQGFDFLNYIRISDTNDETEDMGMGTYYLKSMAREFFNRLSDITAEIYDEYSEE